VGRALSGASRHSRGWWRVHPSGAAVARGCAPAASRPPRARAREAIKACPTPRRRSDSVHGCGCLGSLSLELIARAWIGRQHGLSDTAIRNRAKAKGWTRDLSGAVRSRVRASSVREGVRANLLAGVTPSEAAIVDAVAARGVEVVRLASEVERKAGRAAPGVQLVGRVRCSSGGSNQRGPRDRGRTDRSAGEPDSAWEFHFIPSFYLSCYASPVRFIYPVVMYWCIQVQSTTRGDESIAIFPAPEIRAHCVRLRFDNRILVEGNDCPLLASMLLTTLVQSL
jgi:hypothetical protein